MTFGPQAISNAREVAARARMNCVRLGHDAGPQGAHFGPALSIVEILAVLYGGVMKVGSASTRDPDRDRFILSKGHGSLALYSVLFEHDFIPSDVLATCETDGSLLPGQPIRNLDLGIEFSSGTLGMGLGYGIGLALSARLRASGSHVYVLMGDGETNEGSVWEAALSAAQFHLDNITAIIDVNDMQSDGSTADVLAMNHEGLWRAAGWSVRTVDGHDIGQLFHALAAPRQGQPLVVLAETVKGRGVDFMEHSVDWHHGRLTEDQLELALGQVQDGVIA